MRAATIGLSSFQPERPSWQFQRHESKIEFVLCFLQSLSTAWKKSCRRGLVADAVKSYFSPEVALPRLPIARVRCSDCAECHKTQWMVIHRDVADVTGIGPQFSWSQSATLEVELSVLADDRRRYNTLGELVQLENGRAVFLFQSSTSTRARHCTVPYPAGRRLHYDSSRW